jgi:hypothetical protein
MGEWRDASRGLCTTCIFQDTGEVVNLRRPYKGLMKTLDFEDNLHNQEIIKKAQQLIKTSNVFLGIDPYDSDVKGVNNLLLSTDQETLDQQIKQNAAETRLYRLLDAQFVSMCYPT